MSLRMKAKHYFGVTKTGLYVEDKPIPGCLQYEARQATNEELQGLVSTDRAAYKARVKELPDELGLKLKGHASPVMSLHLAHGDIVIMHGEEIQKYFEVNLLFLLPNFVVC